VAPRAAALPRVLHALCSRRGSANYAVWANHAYPNPLTVLHGRHSEYKDEVVRYPDETWQMIALATSAVVVCSFIGAVVAVVCGIALVKFRIIQHLEPFGLSMVGKGIGGVMQASSIMIFNRIYQVSPVSAYRLGATTPSTPRPRFVIV